VVRAQRDSPARDALASVPGETGAVVLP
jgi:hypothetical protein